MPARRYVVIAAAAGAAVTAAVALSPYLYFAYDRPALHLILETTEGLIALLVVYLLTGRVRFNSRLADTLLIYALAVLGMTNLMATLPPAVAGTSRDVFTTWGPLWTRVVGVAALTSAAFVPFRRRIVRQHLVALIIGAAGATVAAGLVVGQLLEPYMPQLVAAEDLLNVNLESHPVSQGVQLASTAMFAAAAVGFLRRSERHSDELMGWIAVSATVNTFARANYVLFPSLYSEYVYTGDVLRLGAYLLLLVGASREIRSYWRRTAEMAVAEERRKMARDLHDGLAQEVNFVASQVRRLTRRPELAHRTEHLDRIASASQRALDESRRAIDYLAQPQDEPAEVLLARAAQQVAGRIGARVQTRIDGDLSLLPETAEQLVRIVREAVTNATRHGGAQAVELTLRQDDEIVMTVHDDGVGFDPEAVAGSGFGMTSMRERAEALGGVFDVRSRPGHGATVEVRLPSQTQSEF